MFLVFDQRQQELAQPSQRSRGDVSGFLYGGQLMWRLAFIVCHMLLWEGCFSDGLFFLRMWLACGSTGNRGSHGRQG